MEYGISNVTNMSISSFHRPKTLTERAEKLFSEPANIIIVVLSFIGLLANVLTVLATAHIPGRQTTHSKLIISLSLADIWIILSVFLHIVVNVTEPLHAGEFCIEVANKSFLGFSLLASLLNLLVMGIDHYVAVLKPLHYHLIMSPTRTNIMVVAIWVISVLVGFLEVTVGGFLINNDGEDFCLQVLQDDFDATLLILGLVLVEAIILTYLYCHIFHKIKLSSYQAQLNAQSLLRRQSANCNLHSKKAIITTILIVGTFMICWIPYSIYHISGIIILRTIKDPKDLLKYINMLVMIHNVLWILVQCNAIFDPMIYALRTPVVQQGYKCMRNKLLILCRSQENDMSLTRKYSHRESARTYSSEMDLNLAEDTCIDTTVIELCNSTKNIPVKVMYETGKTDKLDEAKKLHLKLASEKPTINGKDTEATKLLVNNNSMNCQH